MHLSKVKSLFMGNTGKMGVFRSILGYIGVFTISSIIMQLIIITIFSSIGIDVYTDDISNNTFGQTLPLFCFGIFTIFAILYVKFVQKRSLSSMGFTKEGLVIKYLKGFLIGIILVSAVLLISVATGAIKYKGINNNVDIVAILLFLFAYIIQGMSEEVMCRGYFMTTLLKKTSIFWSVLISSLAFVFPHLPALFLSGSKFGPLGFVNTMLFSILVSLFMIKGKNIWVISAIHSSWNYFLGTIFGLGVSGGEKGTAILNFTAVGSESLFNGGIYGVEASIITTFILSFSIIILRLTMTRSNKSEISKVIN